MLPNFRRNPLTGHWIIVAEGRDLRPNEYRAIDTRRESVRCPFCGGHEDDTPGESAAFNLQGPNASPEDWVVRVVPNKFPALDPDSPLVTNPTAVHPESGDAFSPYAAFSSGGIHELVVESRRHVASFADLTRDESRLSFRVYRERLARVAQASELAYGMVFKNCRPGAGASIEHTHSQLIGTTIVPASVSAHVDRSVEHARTQGRTLGEDLVDFELRDGARLIAETPRFVAFCPFASHMAYESWVFPKSQHQAFVSATDDELDELADLVHQCASRIDRLLDKPPYNLTLNLPPFDSRSEEHYQWHLELSPRLTKLAGFEWGTGCMILPVAPETAAERLRETDWMPVDADSTNQSERAS